MSSLFNPQTSLSFIERINKLTPETQALWGKMRVDQMLAHSQKPLEIALGTLKPKVNPIIKLLFGKSARKQVLSPEPFKQNLPTLGEAIIAGKREFDTEKHKLIELVQTFHKAGPNGVSREPHPLFGPMSSSDWDVSQVKHLDHHLRQFGV